MGNCSSRETRDAERGSRNSPLRLNADLRETVRWDEPAIRVATGSGVLFGGDTNGRFMALDEPTGEMLWKVNLGSPVTGFPMIYAASGRQYAAVSTVRSATTAFLRGFISSIPPVESDKARTPASVF